MILFLILNDLSYGHFKTNLRHKRQSEKVWVLRYMPKDIWGKAYDKANEWIWANGGEIWDVSHSQCGSFPYKDLDEALNG